MQHKIQGLPRGDEGTVDEEFYSDHAEVEEIVKHATPLKEDEVVSTGQQGSEGDGSTGGSAGGQS